MGGFFRIDGPFFKFGTALADIMVVGIAWFICSLPIITIGPSTTAMYYVMTRKYSDRDGYILKDFFKSFKENFVKATLVWLCILVVGVVLVLNILNIEMLGKMADFLLPFQLIFIVELFMIFLYIFPLLSRFEVKFLSLFKTAFFMANRHILTTIMLLILFAGVFLGINIMPPFLLIAAGAYAYVASILFVRIFRKYRPELDKDPEELALEQAQEKAMLEAKEKEKEKKAKMKEARKKMRREKWDNKN